MKHCGCCYRAEIGKLFAQDYLVNIFGFVGQVVPVESPPPYRKSSLGQYGNRKMQLGSNNIFLSRQVASHSLPTPDLENVKDERENGA